MCATRARQGWAPVRQAHSLSLLLRRQLGEQLLSQAAEKSSGLQESRLDTVLKAIAGVRNSGYEHFAIVREAIIQKADIGQVKYTKSEKKLGIVQEQLKITLQREIIGTVGEEVKRTLQQRVSELVRREVKHVLRLDAKSIVPQGVISLVTENFTVIV